jgi:3-oxoacyl-[acyl-carrier-protein] synthase II
LSDLPPPPQHPQRRVVVTGLGLVTPLGTGVDWTWKRLINGDVAIEKITEFDVSQFPCKIAAMVKRGTDEGEFNAEKLISKPMQSLFSPFIEYALVASAEALLDSQWKPQTEQDRIRTGVVVGSGIGSMQDICETAATLTQKGYKKISPYFIPKILVNMAAGHISIYYGFKGPNHSVSTACATGAHAIGDAYRFIQRGDADVIVCGATEASICPLTLAGFCRMTALSTSFNHIPQKASRPFDRHRDGFVLGEGAGIIVLEELEHARQRGAKIYAEIRGYGVSGDAYHVVAPDDTALSTQHCMHMAIQQSGLDYSLIGYINAHATSTPIGDCLPLVSLTFVFHVVIW